MEQQYIQPAGDFGLAINAATRMYRRDPLENILMDLCKTFETFMPYIDNRTLVCTVIDLMPDRTGIWSDIPSGQEERYTDLRDKIMTVYLNRRIKESNERIRGDFALIEIGREMECIANYHCKGIFPDSIAFLKWAKSHIQSVPGCIAKDRDVIPVTEDYLPIFNTLCLLMVRYSAGRNTYMPSTAADFISSNIGFISEKTAAQILAAVANETDSCWIKMRACLKEKIN